MMIDSDCGMIPVVDEAGRPVGAVTDRDIATRIVAAGIDPSTCGAGDAMTSPVKTVSMTTPSDSMRSASGMSRMRMRVDSVGSAAGRPRRTRRSTVGTP